MKAGQRWPLPSDSKGARQGAPFVYDDRTKDRNNSNETRRSRCHRAGRAGPARRPGGDRRDLDLRAVRAGMIFVAVPERRLTDRPTRPTPRRAERLAVVARKRRNRRLAGGAGGCGRRSAHWRWRGSPRGSIAGSRKPWWR